MGIVRQWSREKYAILSLEPWNRENFGNQMWVIKECGKTRKEPGPKCVPQLFLGLLQGTHGQLLANYFPLSLVTVPEVSANVNSAQSPRF